VQLRVADLHLGDDAPAALNGLPGDGSIRAAALTLIVSGSALLAGCGDEGSDSADPGSSALGSPEVALTAREADCTDWSMASVEQRYVIVRSLSEFEGGPTTGGRGATLPDGEAYDLLERACANDYASAFKLYTVYARAAAFGSVQP